MTEAKQREIVIELEKVKLVRKRAKVSLQNCSGCGRESDFIGLTAAAILFEITEDAIRSFLNTNSVHYFQPSECDKHICVESMLRVLQQQQTARLNIAGHLLTTTN